MTEAAWVQAGSTVVLVLVTIWYAWKTSSISESSDQSAKSAAEAAEAAQQSADANREAVEVSERTMLLAHMPQPLVSLHGSNQQGLNMRILNAGASPAYNVELVLFFGTDPTQQIRSEPWRLRYPIARDGTAEEQVPHVIPFNDWDANKTFESQVRFNDAVGNRFMTKLWHFRDWDEQTPQSTIYLIKDDGSLENLTTNVALTP